MNMSWKATPVEENSLQQKLNREKFEKRLFFYFIFKINYGTYISLLLLELEEKLVSLRIQTVNSVTENKSEDL